MSCRHEYYQLYLLRFQLDFYRKKVAPSFRAFIYREDVYKIEQVGVSMWNCKVSNPRGSSYHIRILSDKG